MIGRGCHDSFLPVLQSTAAALDTVNPELVGENDIITECKSVPSWATPPSDVILTALYSGVPATECVQGCASI